MTASPWILPHKCIKKICTLTIKRNRKLIKGPWHDLSFLEITVRPSPLSVIEAITQVVAKLSDHPRHGGDHELIALIASLCLVAVITSMCPRSVDGFPSFRCIFKRIYRPSIELGFCKPPGCPSNGRLIMARYAIGLSAWWTKVLP
jgi:hypothetical protein